METKPNIIPTVLAFVLVIFLSTILLFFVFLYFSKIPPSQKVKENEITETDTTPGRTTSKITYIQNGDVFIDDIISSNAKKLTSHEEIKYSSQHVASFEQRIIDYSSSYSKYPRLSPDGGYLSYISLTPETLTEIKEREQRILAESKNIKESGMSEIFNPPQFVYQLHIYDIESNTTISTTVLGDLKFFQWSPNSKQLFFVKNLDLHAVNISRDSKSNTLIAEEKSLISNFCQFGCADMDEKTKPFAINSVGTKIASAYLTGNTCKSFLEYKLSVFDIPSLSLNEQPSDKSWCTSIIGYWQQDSLIVVEDSDFRKEYSLTFFRYDLPNWKNKTMLFWDSEYQFKGPIIISPDNKFISYPLGENTFGSMGKVNLRVRDLKSQEYFDVLEFVKDLDGDRILSDKWDSDSQNLYFILENESSGNRSLVKFNVIDKKGTRIVSNASDADIN